MSEINLVRQVIIDMFREGAVKSALVSVAGNVPVKANLSICRIDCAEEGLNVFALDHNGFLRQFSLVITEEPNPVWDNDEGEKWEGNKHE